VGLASGTHLESLSAFGMLRSANSSELPAQFTIFISLIYYNSLYSYEQGRVLLGLIMLPGYLLCFCCWELYIRSGSVYMTLPFVVTVFAVFMLMFH
jgi:hypothetical protein